MKEIKSPEIETELKKVEEERQALIQMYSAGFNDGYNFNKSKDIPFEKIRDKCLKSFNIRFFNQKMKDAIEEKLNKEKKNVSKRK